jgi:hypothetical protein
MAVTVPRPKLNWREQLYLPAIVSGLAITFKHLKNMLLGHTKVTMQYPEQKWDSHLPDYYRGAPALVRYTDGRVSSRIRHRHDPLHLLRNVRRGLSRTGHFSAQRLRHHGLHARGHGASQGKASRDRRSNARRGIEMEPKEITPRINTYDHRSFGIRSQIRVQSVFICGLKKCRHFYFGFLQC